MKRKQSKNQCLLRYGIPSLITYDGVTVIEDLAGTATRGKGSGVISLEKESWSGQVEK
jgi:hypothetical protein